MGANNAKLINWPFPRRLTTLMGSWYIVNPTTGLKSAEDPLLVQIRYSAVLGLMNRSTSESLSSVKLLKVTVGWSKDIQFFAPSLSF